MEIQFVHYESREKLLKIETDEAAAIIAAAVGGQGMIELLDGTRKYETHLLSFYKENNDIIPYIKIFIR